MQQKQQKINLDYDDDLENDAAMFGISAKEWVNEEHAMPQLKIIKQENVKPIELNDRSGKEDVRYRLLAEAPPVLMDLVALTRECWGCTKSRYAKEYYEWANVFLETQGRTVGPIKEIREMLLKAANYWGPTSSLKERMHREEQRGRRARNENCRAALLCIRAVLNWIAGRNIEQWIARSIWAADHGIDDNPSENYGADVHETVQSLKTLNSRR